MSWEIDFLDGIQAIFHCEWMDTLMPPLSSLGDAGIIWIVLSILLLLFPRTRRAGVASAFSLILMLISGNMILKPLISRMRPFTVNTAVTLLIPPPGDFSFPSGHTSAALSCAATWWRYLPQFWRLAAAVCAVLMGLSRLYVGVHFPTDVLCGILVGLFCGWGGRKLEQALSKDQAPAHL